MPLDQTSPQFLGQLRDLAKGFLQWAGEEGQEGHHPPSMQQHQQALQAPQPQTPDADINEPPSYPQKAAGMLLMAPDGRALFVRRQGDDHPGEWSLPGGMTKADEQPWQTAQREATEECGPFDCDGMTLLDHNYDGKLGFTTYGSNVADAFAPTLNHEHDAYQWATPDQAPQPLHPGLKATLDFALDPLTEKGSKIMKSMQSQYGPEKGKSVFYASKNAGKITGVDTPLIDAIPTTHRQDTGIGIPAPTVHPAGRGANPYSANIDNQQRLDFQPNTNDHWASPDWDAGTSAGAKKAAQTRAAGGAVKPSTFAGQSKAFKDYWGGSAGRSVEKAPPKVIRTKDAWASPQWDQSTGKTAEIARAVQGKVDDPQAVAAATRAKMIGRPALQQKAAAARSGDGGSPMQRYKLFDSVGGVLYDIDKPLPFSQSSPVGTEIGGQDDDWGGQTASDPMTKPAMSAPHQVSQSPVPGMGGAARSMPQPGAPMGGGPMGQRNMMQQGPKYTQSVKMDYGGGFVDERKLTRPGGPPPADQQWKSPQWQSPQGQQQDAWPTAPNQQQPPMQPPMQPTMPQRVTPPPQDNTGWPTSATVSPSAMGTSGARR